MSLSGIAVGILLIQSATALMPGFDCLIQPTIQLEAGESSLTNMVLFPKDITCEATMYFEDQSFLPMTFAFHPTTCDTRQVNRLRLPKTVPNGNANVVWRCTNKTPSCSHVDIQGGTADPTAQRHLLGEVGCVFESVETSTTLVTATRTSATSVTSVPTTLTRTTTSFYSQPTVIPNPTESPKKTTTKTLTNTPVLGSPSPTAEVTALARHRHTTHSAATPSSIYSPSPLASTPSSADGDPSAKTPTSEPEPEPVVEEEKDDVFRNSASTSVVPVVTMSILTTVTATVTSTYML